MKTGLPELNVDRVDRPPIHAGVGPTHRVRPLIEPGHWRATDPFLLLMEDWVDGASNFEPHPHRGIETVTYQLEGAQKYWDNQGGDAILSAGEIQWQVAGGGLVHHGEPINDQTIHLLQLWINLPAKDKYMPVDTQHFRVMDQPVRSEDRALIRVLSGRSGDVVSTTRNRTPITMVEVTLEPGARVAQEVPAGFKAFVAPLSGSGAVGASQTAMTAGEIGWLSPSQQDARISLVAGAAGFRALVFAGKPLGEPVAARGPFVMNTIEQLDQAYADYRAAGDRFGLEPSPQRH